MDQNTKLSTLLGLSSTIKIIYDKRSISDNTKEFYVETIWLLALHVIIYLDLPRPEMFEVRWFIINLFQVGHSVAKIRRRRLRRQQRAPIPRNVVDLRVSLNNDGDTCYLS